MTWIIAVLIIAAILIFIFLPEIYAFKGLIAYQKQGAEESLRLYEKAYNTKRASAKTKIRYAILCLKNADPQKSERLLSEIIASPKIKQNQKNMAKQYRCMAYIKEGKSKEALEDSKELLEKYKTSDLYAIIGYCMALENEPADSLLAFCGEAYDYNSDNRDIADNYAVALAKSGDYEKAIEICDEVIENNPHFPEGHFHKAAALAKLGHFDEASEELDALDDCDFKYLTTVSDEDIEKLRQICQKEND